ncbi:MAG: hypothetical protein KKC03_05695 [Bacteroidetes bacterium]|nr:hypothetical protein [Bacteroidota bacterium]
MKPTDCIKLIWDFRGPESFKIAAHHAKHLKEFAQKEALTHTIAESIQTDSLSAVAFLVVTQAEMPAVRDALKPHRGEVYPM